MRYLVAAFCIVLTAAAGDAALAHCFYTITPCRILDTRLPGQGGPLVSGEPRTVAAVGRCGLLPGMRALAINVTGVAPTGGTSLSVGPADGPPTEVSLPLSAGAVRAASVVAALSDAGELALLADVDGGGSVHVVVDVTGYFAGGEEPVAFSASFSGDEGVTCLPIVLAGAPASDRLIFFVTSLPDEGVLFENDDPSGAPPGSKVLCYQPKTRFFHGTDSFTFKAFSHCWGWANGGNGESQEATISITINDVN